MHHDNDGSRNDARGTQPGNSPSNDEGDRVRCSAAYSGANLKEANRCEENVLW